MALIVALLALAVAGCGGGEVDADEVPGAPPAIVLPSDDDLGGGSSNASADSGTAQEDADANADGTADEDAAADTGTTTTPPEDTSGGTTAPEPTATAVPDAPTTDTPPETGSAPEQFEDFCEQNAGAC
jgi:hypothetical protein